MNRPRALLRTTGWMGIAAPVLQFSGQGFLQVGGAEPSFDASAPEIAEFFANRDQTLFAIGSYLSVLSIVALLWFLGGLYALFKEDWRAPIALACGLIYAASSSAGWQAGAFRVPEGLDQQQARFAFDLGNLSFANGWVALGGFAIATGLILRASQSFPRWLAWCAIASGVLLIAARAIWTTPFWTAGYALFWVWVLVVCVRLLRSGVARQVYRGQT